MSSAGNYTGLSKTELNFMMKIVLPASWLAKGHGSNRELRP
jgi:hypothetical protein